MQQDCWHICVAFALPYALHTLPAVNAKHILHGFVHMLGVQMLSSVKL